MDHAPRGRATLRVALAGATARRPGRRRQRPGGRHDLPAATNASATTPNKSVWQELKLAFDADLLKPGENEMQLTVPAGEVTSGVVYDYLRLELDENRQ